MAKILDVFVPGRPKATPRPRAFANKDGKVRAYKPNTAESWEDRNCHRFAEASLEDSSRGFQSGLTSCSICLVPRATTG